MARTITVLIPLLLVGCAALKYQGADPPRVTVAGVRLVSLNVLEQRFAVKLRLQNPNDIALPINGMDYRVELEGQPFASGVSAEPIELPAYGETTVDVTATTNLLANLAQVRQWQRDPPDSLDYKLEGHLSVQGMPFKMNFDYKGTARLTAPE